MLQRYRDLQDIIAILGVDELTRRGQADRQPRPQDRAVLQPAVLRRRAVHRQRRAATRSLAETIRCFDEICDGKWDHLPEQAFMYVGTIEEAAAQAEKLAAQGT